MNNLDNEEMNQPVPLENEETAGLHDHVDIQDAHEDAEVAAAVAELEEEEHFDTYDLNRLYDRLKEVLDENKLKEFRKGFQHARRRYKEIFDEERNRVYQAFIDSGEKAEDFKFTLTPEMVKVKEALNTYQDRLTEIRRKEEAELQANLLTKQDIVHELKDLISNESDIKKAFEKFHSLRDRWKSTGPVSAQHSNDLWNNYKFFSDKFYEFVEINKELYEVELNKNEAAKENIIQRAEALLEQNSITKGIEGLHLLQKEWRETGPVHKDKSDEIWNRFKALVDKIYQRRDEYVKQRDEKRHSNLAAKTALCEKAEALATKEVENMNGWKELEAELKKLDEEWKHTGRVPTQFNDSIWERFKAAKREVFRKKYALLKNVRDELHKNYDAKVKLCEAAETLKDSTDWKNTTQKLIKLQGDWKKIGSVERKKSDEIWGRFRAACDAFFHAKEEYHAGQAGRETENLEKKKALLEEVLAYTPVESLEENLQYMKGKRGEWNSIGFVPLAEKQQIEKAFDDAMNALLEKMHIDKDKKHRMEYKMKLEQMLQSNQADRLLKDERTFVGNRLRKLQEEITQIENNLGFFGHSKGADAFKKQYEDKIEKLRNEVQHLEEKRNQLKTAFKQLEGK